MARTILVPEPIQIVDAQGRPAVERTENGQSVPDPPWTLYRFFMTFILSDSKWGKGAEAAHAGYRVSKVLRGITGLGGHTKVVVDSADWERCRKVLQDPEANWAMHIFTQFIPFVDAFLEAKEGTKEE